MHSSIRRSAKQILESDPEDDQEEKEEEEEEEEDELEMRIQKKMVPTWDPQDMWDALYREEQEIEEMLARPNLIKFEKFAQ